MKPRLFLWLALFFLVLASRARADTWRVNAETFGVSVPASTQYTIYWQIVADLDPNNSSGPVNVLSSGTSTQGTTGGVPAVISYNSGIRTQTVPFHLEVGWKDGSGVFKKTGWRMAFNYTVNPSGGGNGGGYNPNGEPTSLSGQPVDADGNPVATTNNTAIVDLPLNSGSTPKLYRWTTRDAGGNIIHQELVSQPPGSTLRLKLGENQPFSWSLEGEPMPQASARSQQNLGITPRRSWTHQEQSKQTMRKRHILTALLMAGLASSARADVTGTEAVASALTAVAALVAAVVGGLAAIMGVPLFRASVRVGKKVLGMAT